MVCADPMTVRVRSLFGLRRMLPQRSFTLARQDVSAYAQWTLFISSSETDCVAKYSRYTRQLTVSEPAPELLLPSSKCAGPAERAA